MNWFATGLYHETIKLAKKSSWLREHEMLILNGRFSYNSKDEIAEIIDTLADTSDDTIEVESTMFLEEVLSLLTFQQQKVITGIIFEENTENEIASKLCISQPAVHKLKRRAYNKLKQHFTIDKVLLNKHDLNQEKQYQKI